MDPMLLLNFAAERYWVQNVTALILAIVWVPRWLHAYGIPFQSRPQYVGRTQYMATRTAILDIEIVLTQCLEEIAKKEAQFKRSGSINELLGQGRPKSRQCALINFSIHSPARKAECRLSTINCFNELP
jgi:hypothetical protein